MSSSEDKSEWYCDWFDSPYYHTLYKTRDNQEAQEFIRTLIGFLSPAPQSMMLDAACGKGRHAIFLASFGYQVHAFDLSPNNIELARKHESSGLKFFINDIRTPLKDTHYDYAFNMFTSFGYFEDEADNLKALKAIYASLKPGGRFVMDFMNVARVMNHLVEQETKSIDGIDFHIEKSVSNGFIEKRITFSDRSRHFSFLEKVKIITRDQLIDLFVHAGFQVLFEFGDYELGDFNLQESDRIIIIAKK
ncbi:MAG: methyltransferase domain-containing protein [Flavobacteriales bacterium]|nr:methyltransferase domain-containing protein [Flavobacteriales bacterium]